MVREGRRVLRRVDNGGERRSKVEGGMRDSPGIAWGGVGRAVHVQYSAAYQNTCTNIGTEASPEVVFNLFNLSGQFLSAA